MVVFLTLMGETVKSFDAYVLSGVAAVLGTGFVVGAMLALLGGSETTTAMVLADSVPVGTVVGVLLLLTTGAFVSGQRWARYLGFLAFVAVVLFGFPSPSSPSVIPVVHTSLSVLAAVSLLFRNPISKAERSQVDESTSASKVGSTIR